MLGDHRTRTLSGVDTSVRPARTNCRTATVSGPRPGAPLAPSRDGGAGQAVGHAGRVWWDHRSSTRSWRSRTWVRSCARTAASASRLSVASAPELRTTRGPVLARSRRRGTGGPGRDAGHGRVLDRERAVEPRRHEERHAADAEHHGEREHLSQQDPRVRRPPRPAAGQRRRGHQAGGQRHRRVHGGDPGSSCRASASAWLSTSASGTLTERAKRASAASRSPARASASSISCAT